MPDAVPVSQKVKDRFPDAVLATHQFVGDDTIVVRREAWLPVAAFLRDDPGMAFNFLMDLTAVDYSRYPPRANPPGLSARFEVVAHLYSLEHNHRLRMRMPIPEAAPVAPSLTALWKSADWFEREVWDMFGIRFEGHPNLRRLLMYEEFEGHPLRKDYPVNKRQPLVGSVQ